MRHVKFLARTVLVQNNNVEDACRVLNRILGKEGILDDWRRTRFYEKPYQVSSGDLRGMTASETVSLWIIGATSCEL